MMEQEYNQGIEGQQFMPSQIYSQRDADQILKIVLENEDLITLLEHEFRGEVYVVENDEGKWKKKYSPIIKNTEGINEILRILRFMGLNKVSILTNLNEDQINAKLRTFEMKLADLLFLKRRDWGIDKEYMPMIYHLIISIVEDAFFRAKDGNLVKTLRSTYQRVESSSEDKGHKRFGGGLLGFGRDNPLKM